MSEDLVKKNLTKARAVYDDLVLSAGGEKQNYRELQDVSLTDALTGKPNRRAWDKKIEELSAKRTKDFSIAIIDIDHFKSFNDKYGHDVGDLVLQKVSDVLESHKRSDAFLARSGGEEFALIIYGDGRRNDSAELKEYMESIVSAMDKTPLQHKNITYDIKISIGATPALLDNDQVSLGEDPKSTIKRADMALYRAKEQGRNRAVVIPVYEAKDMRDIIG